MKNLTQTPKPKKTIHPKEEKNSILFLAVRLIHRLAYKGISATAMREILIMSNFNKELYRHLLDVGILRLGIGGLYYRGTEEPSEHNISKAYKMSSSQTQSRFDKFHKEEDDKGDQSILPQINFEEVNEVTPVSTGQQDSYQEFLEYRQFLAWKNSQNN
jgi:hypothetical protein